MCRWSRQPSTHMQQRARPSAPPSRRSRQVRIPRDVQPERLLRFVRHPSLIPCSQQGRVPPPRHHGGAFEARHCPQSSAGLSFCLPRMSPPIVNANNVSSQELLQRFELQSFRDPRHLTDGIVSVHNGIRTTFRGMWHPAGRRSQIASPPDAQMLRPHQSSRQCCRGRRAS